MMLALTRFLTEHTASITAKKNSPGLRLKGLSTRDDEQSRA